MAPDYYSNHRDFVKETNKLYSSDSLNLSNCVALT